MSADYFDDASDMEELHRNLAIKNIRDQKKNLFSGHCLYCNDTISEGRFCSQECREAVSYTHLTLPTILRV